MHDQFLRRIDGALGEALRCRRHGRRDVGADGECRLATRILRVGLPGRRQQQGRTDGDNGQQADGKGTGGTRDGSGRDKMHVLKILSEVLDNQAEV
ncbi:MAG: hypothetical protein K2W80_06575 [Burkholderiales bacterium]|nr:hypothetical protein [Burkholderiales bacterium]